jgi:DNA-binding NarL/FixJ family response regulator
VSRDRGWCPVCRRGPFVVLLAGSLKTHGPRDNRCEGSWEDPLHEPPPKPPKRIPRTIQALALAAEGLTNGEIGEKLHVTEDTVKAHLRRIYRKLDARDRAHAVHIACHRGLLPCHSIESLISR